MTRIHEKLLCLLAASAMALGVGCIGQEPGEGEGLDGDKADAWNAANDPRRFSQSMEYNWEVLRAPELTSGASKIIPWPDTYWPMKADGYNDRWLGNGLLSPAELYDKAFNQWEPSMGWEEFLGLRRFEQPGQAYDAEYYSSLGPVARWSHEVGGHYRARSIWNPDGTLSSRVDADGDGIPDSDLNGDGEIDSEDRWGGLEGWFGHCHAWAPAAYMAPEPQRAVTVNGTTFEIADIKAVIGMTYERIQSLFLGGRCNARDVTRDEFGRPTDVECRDTNAGALHVVLLNRMGMAGESFVIDATWDYQVWNQPVRDYQITRQEEVTLEQALALLGRSGETSYPYNSDARRFVHVNTTLRYVVEGAASRTPYIPVIDSYTRTHRYNYVLELDQAGNIIGGEWIDNVPHPDFIWAALGPSDVRNGYGPVIVRAADVQRLIDLSTATEDPEEPVDGTDNTYGSEPGLDIPDNDRAGVSDTIVVPDGLTIDGLRVNVNITHTYRGDLRVELVREGRTVTLFSREGGGADDLIQSFSVADFNGEDAAGQWTLRVSDEANVDTGTLNSWQLVVITR